MAVEINGVKTYEGAVVKTSSYSWLDGMYSVYAIVWDMEAHEFKDIKIGYYGIDGQNLVDGSCDIDLTTEVARDIIRTMKMSAYKSFCTTVTEHKNSVAKGMDAVVVRGRKVKKGTKLNVFWVGERPTYQSQRYSYINETELIAGCYDEKGNKVWIKAEYLKSITPIKSPCAAERKKFVDNYIKHNADSIVLRMAMGGC
jgi:hypothetical protein